MKKYTPFITIFFVSFLFSNIFAQQALDIPLAFNGTILNLAHYNGVNYVTGNFTQVGNITGSCVKYNFTTKQRNTNFPIVNGRINTIEPDGMGGYYLGGEFTKVGNLSRNRLAQIDQNGNVTSWNPNVNMGLYPYVYDLKKIDQKIFVAGSFEGINGVSQPYLATLALDGSLIPWSLIPDDEVYTITQYQNNIFIGGAFIRINGIDHNKLAIIDYNGNIQPVNISANNSVKKIIIHNDTVYAVGSFTRFNGISRNRVASFSLTGELFDFAPKCNGSVESIEILNDKIILGGKFTMVNDNYINYLAAVNFDGSLINWVSNTDNFVFTIEKFENEIIIGGNFSNLMNNKRSCIASIDENLNLLSFNPKANTSVFAVAKSNNDLIFGGTFTSVEGYDRKYLAAIDDNGNVLDWYPQVNYPVYTITIKNDIIYLSGYFNLVNDQTRNYIAALDLNGNLLPWAPSLNKPAFSIFVTDDKIYLGGRFTSVNSINRNYLASVDLNGNLTDWNPNVNNQINSLAVSDSAIYIGGFFTKVNNFERNRFAAFDINGNLLPLNLNFDNTINSIHLLDNQLYIGGWFNSVNSITRNNLVSLDLSGTILPWNPNANSTVWNVSSSAFAGGIIYVCGDFTSLSGNTRNYLGAINRNGILQSWAPNPDNSVLSITLSENSIYTGGLFKNVNQNLSPSFAGYQLQLILPESPTLIAPNTDSIDIRINPTLSWTSGLYATKYHLQISPDPNFNSFVYENANITGTEFSLDSVTLNYNTKYYWRVRAKNNSGNSDFTEIRNFTTIISPPAIPTLTEPANLSEGIFLTPLFKWQLANFATDYRIQVATDSDFSNIIMDVSNLILNQQKINQTLDKLTNYYWRVKSHNRNTSSNWSNTFTFKTAETQLLNIYLKQGWNIISSNLLPQNDSLNVILSGIVDNIVIMKNGSGQSFVPAYNINSIGLWKVNDGYQLYMSKADTLEVIGLPINPETNNYNLKTGWNLISFIPGNPISAESAFASLTSTNNLIICKNAAGQTYIPAYNLNSIGNLIPGQGYLIYITNAVTFYYPNN